MAVQLVLIIKQPYSLLDLEESLIMKAFTSILFVPILVLASGCSTRVSSTHGHHYGHHNQVSVGIHGRSSGAGILGALIVGGVINSIIHDAEHHSEEDLSNNSERQSRSKEDEIVNGYEISEVPMVKQEKDTFDSELEEFEQNQSQQAKAVEWYQVGKDGNCYKMKVDNGITDILAAVPNSQCEAKLED